MPIATAHRPAIARTPKSPTFLPYSTVPVTQPPAVSLNLGSDYVRGRWLKDRPTSDQDAVRRVGNHFFATGNRGLIRDNGVSRLWWLGRVAHDVAPDNPRKFLDILLHRQDVRSALIERPSVSMNRTVLKVVFRVMEEFWDGDQSLFARERFREWMVSLNRRGGVILLDAIPEGALYQLVRGDAVASL